MQSRKIVAHYYVIVVLALVYYLDAESLIPGSILDAMKKNLIWYILQTLIRESYIFI